jgi:predicted dehydrogenase
MGWVHARNLVGLARDTGHCEVVGLVDADRDRAQRFAQEHGCSAQIFTSVRELAEADICRATMIVTPTEKHREHATELIKAGHRVLLEKPLTGSLKGDREFAAGSEIIKRVMLAFQRVSCGVAMRGSGSAGRSVGFKFYWALEDANPAPDGWATAFCRTCRFTMWTRF